MYQSSHVSFKSPSIVKEYESFSSSRELLNKPSCIITASSWRVGEALAQKQLKHHQKTPLSSTVDLNDQTSNRTSRSKSKKDLSISDQKSSSRSPRQTNLKLKKTEHFLVDDQIPVKDTNKNKQKTPNQPDKYKASKHTKSYDLEDVHKYMLDKKTKRLFATKSEKQKQKREEEERKRKLAELYQKQRLQNPTIKTSLVTSEIKKDLVQRSKSTYEQDVSKELQDKINVLLQDNDKLVERKRLEINLSHEMNNKRTKLVNFADEEYSESSSDYDEDEEINQLQNLTNNQDYEYETRSSFEYKHDRLKKICSMALDLQTKLQQTKLKLFGVNQDEDDVYAEFNKFSSKITKKNVSDEEDDDYVFKMIEIQKKERKSDLPEIHIIDEDQVSLPGVTNLKNFKPAFELSPDTAATRIQTAFRKFINKKSTTISKPHESKRLTNKRQIKLKEETKRVKESFGLLKSKSDEYNFINVFKKKAHTAPVMKKVSRLSLSKHLEQEEKITSKRSPSRSASNKLKKNLTKKTSTSTSESTDSSSSTSLSKYMNEPEDVLIKEEIEEVKEITNSSRTSSSTVTSESKVEVEEINDEVKIQVDDEVTEDTTRSTRNSSTESNTSSDTITDTLSLKSPKYSKLKSKTPSPITTQLPHASSPKSHKRIIVREPQKEIRYSPSSLEYLLNAGLNYLDTLNVSALHIEELDKMRCIGQAQQDTVALACLLKEKQNKALVDLQQMRQTSSIIKSKSESSSQSSSASSSSYSNDFETNKSQANTVKDAKEEKASISTSFSYTSESESEQTLKNNNYKTKSNKDESLINTVSDLDKHHKTMSIQENISTNTDETDDVEEEEVMERSFKEVLPSKSHLNKTKQDHSIAESISSLHSSRISFEDDSFKKFTNDIVKKYMQEEETRSKHQAHLLRLREKALIDKTKAELKWLEQMKTKAQDKGEDEKMPSILRKEKGIMKKLKQEQESIQQLKEVQRVSTEKRMQLLSKHSEVLKWCQNKLKNSVNLNDSNDEESLNLSLNVSKFKDQLNTEK